jgi:hypothetical protein
MSAYDPKRTSISVLVGCRGNWGTAVALYAGHALLVGKPWWNFAVSPLSAPPVTKVAQPIQIHENTLFLTRRPLKHSFEFSTIV